MRPVRPVRPVRIDARIPTAVFGIGTLAGIAIVLYAEAYMRDALAVIGTSTTDESFKTFRAQTAIGSILLFAGGLTSIGGAALTALSAYHWRRQSRLKPGHCAVCGYAERGWSSERCPECGTVTQSATMSA